METSHVEMKLLFRDVGFIAGPAHVGTCVACLDRGYAELPAPASQAQRFDEAPLSEEGQVGDRHTGRLAFQAHVLAFDGSDFFVD